MSEKNFVVSIEKSKKKTLDCRHKKILKEKIFFEDKVIHGLGRGGKILGCPTANVKINDKKKLCGLDDGVYMGFAKLKSNEIFKSVFSVGLNPHFGDIIQKTFEAHLIEYEGDDFYGETLKICIVGYLRNMRKYKNLKELKNDISTDIKCAKKELEKYFNLNKKIEFFQKWKWEK